jgi:hypothetical protein
MSDAQTKDLVHVILEITAPITQMLDHMMRAPGQPDITEVVETMRGLLEDVLEPLAEHEDTAAATALLTQAEALIAENIFFVPHPSREPNREERRRAARRRGRH